MKKGVHRLAGPPDVYSPPDLKILMQLTSWIKELQELQELDPWFANAQERAIEVLKSWERRWYQTQAGTQGSGVWRCFYAST